MRKIQPLGQDDSSLGGSLIVRLQTRQNEVKLLDPERIGEDSGDRRRVGSSQTIVFNMDSAIRTSSKRLTEYLCASRWSGRAHDNLAAMLLTQAKRLLERVGIRLVHLEACILLTNSTTCVIDPRLPLARRNLLDADGDVHVSIVCAFSIQFSVFSFQYSVFSKCARTQY